jgi:hypothetical protein
MKKTTNKVTVIIFAICAVVLAILITVLAFFDCWVGNVKLSQLRKGILECDEVLITSPLHFDGYSSVAEAMLTDEEAQSFSRKFADIADNVSFCGTLDGGLGYWDTKLTFSVDGERYTAYVKEDMIYVTGKFGYCFEPQRDAKEEYKVFYSELEQLLDSTK